jgi:ubiquinone/menaquinone biosynthesis C-methylase UbiE
MGMEGAVAKWYANLTRKGMAGFTALAQRVANEILAGSKVLEVAPGPGYFAIELARLGNYQITGLDISKTFVEIAQANAAKAGVKVDFQLGNASSMPFENDTFDFILCRAAFKNFTTPLLALKEMYRVLRPGGKALIIDLRRDASKESVGQAVNAMHLGNVNGAITKLTFRFMLLKRAYTKSEFEHMLAQAKIKTGEIQQDSIGMEVTFAKSPIAGGLQLE